MVSSEVMKKKNRLRLLANIKRVVIKIGSGVLASSDGSSLSFETLERLVSEIHDLEKERGFEVIIVSSGAVMAGSRMLHLKQKHISIPMKQACASVGQVQLINLFNRLFEAKGKKIGQMLLTHDDISNRRRYLNAKHTITSLLEVGVLPIINENDSAAVHELKFGDNDALSAMVTSVCDADLLLILSDVEGLYDADPHKKSNAKLIADVTEIDMAIKEMAGERISSTGVGGMKTKVSAAETASAYGVPTWIISGKIKGAIKKALLDGEGGTFFHPNKKRVTQRKYWISHILKTKGKVTIDDGAKNALVNKNRSLLPSGILSVDGHFESGDSVWLLDENGNELAKGLSNYHSFEIEKILGKNSSDIESLLGYKSFDEVVNRDDLVLINRSEK